MRDRTRWTASTVAATACLLAVATPAALRGQQGELRPVDETRAVARDANVRVETLIRDVRVVGWDRGEVRVRGAYHPEYEEFRFEGDRGSVDIEIDREDDHRGWPHDDLPEDAGTLTISVPTGASLEVDVVSGELVVEGVDGSVELESVNGDVRYTGGSTNLEVEAVNGVVEVEAPAARRTRAGSVNGDVVLRIGGGFVEAEAVSGDVQIRADGPVETVSAETVSGDVEFRGSPVEGASLAFETHSGDVVVHLPRDVQARLEATTFSGRIESAFGGEPTGSSRWTPEQAFRHTVGSGNVRVSAESFSGDVRFLRDGGG